MLLYCAKCGRKTAMLEWDFGSIAIHCLCGYYQIIVTKEIHISAIPKNSFDISSIILPGKKTKLMDILKILAKIGKGTSKSIKMKMKKGTKATDIAACLVVLRYRHLVDREDITSNERDSLWALTDEAMELLGIEIED